MPPISVFACESQPLMVEGLRKALADYEDLRFAGSITNNNDALDALCRARPDVALIDLSGGLTRALRLVGGLKAVSDSSHVVLWVVDLPEGDALRALQMGVRGIVKKTLPVEKLIECLREVGAGKIWTDESEPVIEFFRGKESARLTPRERQIVALICRGLKNKQIAEHLHITPGTVKVHLMHISEKTGLKHRLALAVHGRDLIGPERWFEESVKS